MWYVPIMEYYSDLITYEIMKHATMWENFGNIINKIRQTQRDKCLMIPLISGTLKKQLIETAKILEVIVAGGRKEWGEIV